MTMKDNNQIYYKSMSSNKDNNEQSSTNSLFQIFKDSNIVIIAWFLAVYFVVYLLLNIFRGRDGARSSISKWIDIISLMVILIYLGTTYFFKTNDEKKEIVGDTYNNFKNYIDNPLSIISSIVFILTLYIVIYILALPMDSAGKPITIKLVENFAWLLLVVVLFTTFLRYISGVSVTSFMDEVGDYLHKKSEEAEESHKDVKGNTSASSSSVQMDEVFNIGNNMFTYDDAQSVCASFGARLATYDEIENTYNSGGEWCNYGWSEGQTAYFPTQKDTWQRLQKSESTKHSCGRPGVNGGFINNPNVRFGVNCFGKKPKPSTSDLSAMMNGSNIPKTKEEILLEKKIEFWNANRDKLLKINGYNNNKWSMY
jgi:hypothetical protein